MKATNTIKLSTTTLKQTTDTVRGEIRVSNKWVKLSDLFRAEKVTASMLETAKKGGDEGLRDQVKAAIVAAFTDKERKLLAADTKTLNPSDKGTKKTLQQNVGAYLSKIQAHIQAAEKVEESEGGGTVKTEVQRIHELLDRAVAKMQKLNTPSFDTVEFVKRINAAKGMMPAL